MEEYNTVMAEYQTKNIRMDKIYLDNEFNCRGAILPMDVVDLAKDIEINGLQFPIAVQPASDVSDKEVPDGKLFRIVAGHRRFIAYTVNKQTEIPAMVKTGLSELRARLINLNENLKRSDLNILQEAGAVNNLRTYGMTQENIAIELGKSRTWVQIRLHLLRLPVDIQAEAAAGCLNQGQIRDLFSLDSNEQRYAAVRKIKDARLRGESSVSVGKTAKEDPFKKKRQSKSSVQDMIDHMGNSVGFGLHTRVLAWANGAINSAELFCDIKMYAAEHDLVYDSPLDSLV